MNVLIVVGIIVFISIGTRIFKKLQEGKIAQADLIQAKSEINELRISDASLKDLKVKFQQTEEQHHQAIIRKDHLFKQFRNMYEATVSEKDHLFRELKNKNNKTLEYISSLVADHLTIQYEISARFLETKRNPARLEAQRIRRLQAETKEILQRSKILQYKYEFLFQLFPDLELYVDDLEAISELANVDNLEDLANTVDRTRHYLSPEEYSTLPENERNQIALDRYVKSQKTKWQIGRDYELFVGHEYEKNGWQVEYFGIDKQLEDMGRDLIAIKDNEIHIVQCKYWAQHKSIHENQIAQLFGTTAQFSLSSHSSQKVVPFLVTNIALTETARDFAKCLAVKVIENKPISEFPRIKCNINRDEWGCDTKIYHLPMDQQYDKTKICKKGEFFAFTVQEAVDAGFRRAWRWHVDGMKM
jgi:hypothetical protein